MALWVIKNSDCVETPIRERCAVTEWLNDPAKPDISVARCRVEPGVTTELHVLEGAQELYVILSGDGWVDDGRNGVQAVMAGDVVVIAPNQPQRIENTGVEDMVFLAICTPRFTPQRYQSLE